VDAKSRHKQFPMAARTKKTTLKWTVCATYFSIKCDYGGMVSARWPGKNVEGTL
jgi:hypothetical protein